MLRLKWIYGRYSAEMLSMCDQIMFWDTMWWKKLPKQSQTVHDGLLREHVCRQKTSFMLYNKMNVILTVSQGVRTIIIRDMNYTTALLKLLPHLQ